MQELVNVMVEIKDLLKEINNNLSSIDKKIDSASIEVINKLDCGTSDIYNQLVNVENAMANVENAISHK